MIYREVSMPEFLSALNLAKEARREQGLCVSAPEVTARLFVSEDGQSGFALDGDYLGSVFSRATGRLAGMVTQARRLARADGQRALRLDCFAPLAAVYERHGFTRTADVAFDWAYAPEGWTPAMGEPDVVFMAAPLSERPTLAPVSAREFAQRVAQ